MKKLGWVLAFVLFILALGFIDWCEAGDFVPPPDPCPDGSCDKRPYPVEIWPDGNYTIVLREWFQTDKELNPLISFSSPLIWTHDE